MKVAIHQPNFLPWLGYFHKIYISDKFVFLTEVQRSKNDKFLTRATIINNAKKKHFLSIPLGKDQCLISHLKMPKNNEWKEKFVNIIIESYRNSNYFEQVYPSLEELIKYECENFFEYSINFIKFFASNLNIKSELIRDTEIVGVQGESNYRNISITKNLNGDEYISGVGAKSYNSQELFDKNSISLVYQNYIHKDYPQHSTKFEPGLSILDALFNCGYEATESLIKSKPNEIRKNSFQSN